MTQRFVRNHLHKLIGIEHTADMAKFGHEIFANDTPLQRRMARYEEHNVGEPPALEPMRINWKALNGTWNEALCEKFVQYCIEEGFGDGNPNKDEIGQIVDIFWERLGRLRTWINTNRPKGTETVEETEIRSMGKHRDTLVIARRNTRRQQVRVDCKSSLGR